MNSDVTSRRFPTCLDRVIPLQLPRHTRLQSLDRPLVPESIPEYRVTPVSHPKDLENPDESRRTDRVNIDRALTGLHREAPPPVMGTGRPADPDCPTPGPFTYRAARHTQVHCEALSFLVTPFSSFDSQAATEKKTNPALGWESPCFSTHILHTPCLIPLGNVHRNLNQTSPEKRYKSPLLPG